MAATLRIRAKNEAKPELAALAQDLDHVETAAGDVNRAFEAITQSELSAEIHALVVQMKANTAAANDQKPVVVELRKSWLEWSADLINNLKTVGGAIRDVTGFTIEQVRNVKELAQTHRTAAVAVTVAENAAIRGAAGWTSYGAAVGSTLSIVGGLKLGLLAMNTVLDATGQKKNAFGEMETNLDRARAATRGLKEDIAALAGEGVSEIQRMATETAAWGYEVSGLKAGWKEFDYQMTERTGNWVKNARALGSAIRGVSRDAIDASEKLKESQEASKADFERVREANQTEKESAEARSQAIRIAQLQTSEAIDAEIAKLRERRGIMAADHKFDVDAQRKYLDGIEALESRRTQLLDEHSRKDAEARKKQADATREIADWAEKIESKAFEDRNAAILKENEAFRKEEERQLDEEVKAILQQHQEQQKAFEQLTRMKADEAKKQRDDYIARWREAVGEVAAIVRGQQGGGSDQIEALRNSLSQRDVAKQVGNQRAQAAVQEFDLTANDWRNRLRDQGVDGAAADARIANRRRQVERDAFSRGFGDVVRGKASPDEIAGAQNNMIQAVVQNAQASGELTPVVAQGLAQAAQQAIQATQDAQQAKAIAMQVLNALNANGQRQRATQGTLKR